MKDESSHRPIWGTLFTLLALLDTYLVISGLGYIVHLVWAQATPEFFGLLPSLWKSLLAETLIVKLASGFGALLAIITLIWLTILSFQRIEINKQRREGTQAARIAEVVADTLKDRMSIVGNRGHYVHAEPTGAPRAVELIGRDSNIREIIDDLISGGLVDIHAPNSVRGGAGVGKTALAAEIAWRLSEDHRNFPGGVAWIACEGLTGKDGLADIWLRVALALQLDEIALLDDPNEVLAKLRTALSMRPQTLLVLDNVEPIFEAGAVVDNLYIRGHSKLLLTSRRAAAPEKTTARILDTLPISEAAMLFEKVLIRCDRHRTLATDDRAMIAKIATILGGLPLAIELYASQAGVTHTDLNELREQLLHEGLSTDMNSADEVRAAIEKRFTSSWDQLTEDQKYLLAGLTILSHDTFPREVALAMATDTRSSLGRQSRAKASTDVNALVQQSIVRVLQDGKTLRLLPLFRQYAAARRDIIPSDTLNRMGIAAAAYWYSLAKRRQRLVTSHQKRHFVSAQFRSKLAGKDLWLKGADVPS